MKHQTLWLGGRVVPQGNILDFHAELPEVWGSNPGGEKKFVCVYLPSLSYKCYVAVCWVCVCIVDLNYSTLMHLGGRSPYYKTCGKCIHHVNRANSRNDSWVMMSAPYYYLHSCHISGSAKWYNSVPPLLYKAPQLSKYTVGWYCLTISVCTKHLGKLSLPSFRGG